jgi:hypothetical protein
MCRSSPRQTVVAARAKWIVRAATLAAARLAVMKLAPAFGEALDQSAHLSVACDSPSRR